MELQKTLYECFRDLTEFITEKSFASTRELADAIIAFLAARNENPRRYVWKAKGEDILRKINAARAALAVAQGGKKLYLRDGTLAIPDGKLEFINRKYAKIRPRLPQEKAEVKGRLLTEPEVNEVVTLLARNDALFEITAIDLGFHAESDVAAYKQKHAEGMLARGSVSRARPHAS